MINRCERVGSVGHMGEFPDFKVRDFDIQKYNERFHNANVIIDASAKQIYYPEHWGGLSIKCAFNGSEYYRTKKTLYRVDDSSFLVFNEGNLYSSWIDEANPVQSFTLNMTPSFEMQATSALFSPQHSIIDDPSKKYHKQVRFLECLYKHGGDVTSIMMQMRRLADDLASNSMRLEEMFFELFVSMNRLQSAEHFTSSDLSQPGRREVYQRLLRARDFMTSCYNRDLSLSEIAGIACMNKFHFLRQFKKVFNQTPHQFLTGIRINIARNRIAGTSDPLDQICHDAGYTDMASFSKLFKKLNGYSPGAFRALNA